MLAHMKTTLGHDIVFVGNVLFAVIVSLHILVFAEKAKTN